MPEKGFGRSHDFHRIGSRATGSALRKASAMHTPKVRHVPLHFDEWLVGQASLDNACRGLYLTACLLIYSHGGTIHVDELKRNCRDHGQAFNRQLSCLIELGKLSLNDGQITNKRATNELQIAHKRIANGQQNVAKRWKNTGLDVEVVLAGANANHKPITKKEEANASSISLDTNVSNSSKRGLDKPPDRFMEFYAAYPRREDRRSAERAWKAACKRASPETIIAAAGRYAETRDDENKKFTKLPATWLNADAWANEEVAINGHTYRKPTPEEHEAGRREAYRQAGICFPEP